MNILDLYITKEDILSRISEEQIFEYYFGDYIDLNKKYINPLRKDNKPGCWFFYGESDLIFYDIAEKRGYRWVEFIKEKYSDVDTYDKVLRRVATDFNLVKSNKSHLSSLRPLLSRIKKEKVNVLKDIKFSITSFRDEHVDFWSTIDYTFTADDFYKFRVLPFSYFALEFEKSNYVVYEDPIGFVYFLTPDKKQKQVYMPFSSHAKKFRQKQKDNIFGFEYLEKDAYVILTKSYKDYIILKLAGFNALCILSESYKLTPTDYMKIRKYGKLVTLFDPDATGIKRSQDIQKQFGSIPLFLKPNVKDPYGHYKKFGLNDLRVTMNSLLISL